MGSTYAENIVCSITLAALSVEVAVHLCQSLASIKRNKTGSLGETWKDLDAIMQSEVSRRKTVYNLKELA